MTLNITIIGAGIAGLTTAIALRQRNPYNRITILEKSTRNEEFGAALHLGPNCTGFLRQLGLRLQENAGAVRVKGMRQLRGASGEVRMRLDLEDVSRMWEHPWWTVHRIDFHRELKRVLFEECTHEGAAPELVLGAVVETLDSETGQVLLRDGRVFDSDVIIGADGNASFCRSQIDPAARLQRWDKAAFRFLVPRETLLEDPQTKDFVVDDGWYGEISEADRRMVFYQCRAGSMVNVVAFVPNAEANASGHDIDWNQGADKQAMMRAFESWYPAARKFLSCAPDDLRVWQLYDMPTLQGWTKGRLAVIGDAAHPFLPFLGQGASMAIEDAACITEILDAVSDTSRIPEQLRAFEAIRKERVEWTRDQARINAMNEDVRPPTKGGFVTLKVCHGHDESRNTREWMQRAARKPPVEMDARL